MADLDGRPPPELRQLKRESASHRFTASRAVSDRQSRNVEGQIETDDRSAQVIGPSEQHVVDEFRNGSQHVSTLAAEPSKQRKIVYADDGGVIEEARLIKFVGFAELICANAQTLRRVHGGLGIEDERPFGWRRQLTRSRFTRWLGTGFRRRRRYVGAQCDGQAIGLNRG